MRDMHSRSVLHLGFVTLATGLATGFVNMHVPILRVFHQTVRSLISDWEIESEAGRTQTPLPFLACEPGPACWLGRALPTV